MNDFNFDFRDDDLRGRVVLVAGGSGGLGAAATALLARDGAEIVVGFRSNRRRAELLRDFVAESYGRTIHLVQGDLSDADARIRYFEEAAKHGPLYGLACLTGDPARVPLEQASEELLLESLAANYTGPLLLARDGAAMMRRNAISGSIVLLSSMQALTPFAGSISYAGPKAALTHAARIMARQWSGPCPIRVNVVAPGVNRAGMALQSIQAGKYDPFLENGRIPRFGKAEDVARLVRFLMHPDNYVTGQVIAVDGGFTLHG